jgi:hypothetical protein
MILSVTIEVYLLVTYAFRNKTSRKSSKTSLNIVKVLFVGRCSLDLAATLHFFQLGLSEIDNRKWKRVDMIITVYYFNERIERLRNQYSAILILLNLILGYDLNVP